MASSPKGPSGSDAPKLPSTPVKNVTQGTPLGPGGAKKSGGKK